MATNESDKDLNTMEEDIDKFAQQEHTRDIMDEGHLHVFNTVHSHIMADPDRYKLYSSLILNPTSPAHSDADFAERFGRQFAQGLAEAMALEEPSEPRTSRVAFNAILGLYEFGSLADDDPRRLPNQQ